MEEYVKIGQVRTAHGLEGEVAVFVEGFSEALLQGSALYIPIHHTYVPHFIEYVREHAGLLLVKLEDVSDRTQAKHLKGKSIYITQALAAQFPQEQSEHDALMGFQVLDQANQVLGTLIEIQTTTPQECLVVGGTNDKKTMLIPFVDPIVKAIDTERRVIYVDLPEGYLSLFQ